MDEGQLWLYRDVLGHAFDVRKRRLVAPWGEVMQMPQGARWRLEPTGICLSKNWVARGQVPSVVKVLRQRWGIPKIKKKLEFQNEITIIGEHTNDKFDNEFVIIATSFDYQTGNSTIADKPRDAMAWLT